MPTSLSAGSPVMDGSQGHAPRLDLQTLLDREQLVVLDMVRGIAPGTRRLLVGEHRTGRATYVVVVASDPAGDAAVASETWRLRALGKRLDPEMRSTVPKVGEPIMVGGATGVVLSAVPGTGTGFAVPTGTAPEQVRAVLVWLTTLWTQTGAPDASEGLGRESTDRLLEMLDGSRGAAATVATLVRARTALDVLAVRTTWSHGCLCPRHVRFRDGRVVGVDDWGVARPAGDPLRDLGQWVVASAGSRINSVLSGRGATSRAMRELVADGLGHWGLPASLWRDVVVLCLAEVAVEGLDRGDRTFLDILTALGRPSRDGRHRPHPPREGQQRADDKREDTRP